MSPSLAPTKQQALDVSLRETSTRKSRAPSSMFRSAKRAHAQSRSVFSPTQTTSPQCFAPRNEHALSHALSLAPTQTTSPRCFAPRNEHAENRRRPCGRRRLRFYNCGPAVGGSEESAASPARRGGPLPLYKSSPATSSADSSPLKSAVTA